MSKISIIVPAYNSARYIRKCLTSIQYQEHKNLEIIVVDDGSTDGTRQIVSELAKYDRRIILLTGEHRGQSAARQAGVRLATGDWVYFVDSDDYIASNMIVPLYRRMCTTNSDFVDSGYVEEDETGKEIKKHLIPDITIDFDKTDDKIRFICEHVFKECDYYMAPSMWTKLYRIGFIKDCMSIMPDIPPMSFYGEDFLLLLIALLRCRRVSLVNESNYHYIARSGSLSRHDHIFKFWHQMHLAHYVSMILDRFSCRNALSLDAFYYFKAKMIDWLKDTTEYRLPSFCLSNIDFIKDKKIILYGAGNVGHDFYFQLSHYNTCAIVAWCDKNWQNITNEFFEITSLQTAITQDFDVILIAVLDKRIAEGIKNLIIENGVDNTKIIWMKPQNIFANLEPTKEN